MKRISTLLALIVALCMVLSVGAFASGEPSGSAEPAAGIAGTYSDGEHTLVIADDLTFTLEKTGQNLEGEDFVMLVTGTVTEDGVFTITGLYDGDINLVEVASEEQLAADLASVEAVYAAGSASGEPSGEGGDWDAYIAYLTDLVNSDPSMDLHDQFLRELSEAKADGGRHRAGPRSRHLYRACGSDRHGEESRGVRQGQHDP